MVAVSDKHGNQIIRIGPELYLKLHGETCRRMVGYINNHVLIVRREPRHIHRKSNSYGFNDYILRNRTLFDSILIVDSWGTYLVPVDEILKRGKYLYFKQQGFELQIFINRDILKEYHKKAVI